MLFDTKIRRTLYHIKYRYPTREIMTVILIGLAIVWFIWGSVQAMQKNYELKKVVQDKQRQAKLVDLQTKTLEYEQNYLKSDEYKKLAARQYLGYGDPGEKVLILPPNSAGASDEKAVPADATIDDKSLPKPSNISQWANFLFGANAKQ